MFATTPSRLSTQPMFVRTPAGAHWRPGSSGSTYSPPGTPTSSESDVLKAVSHLLGLTKQLREVVHLWGLRQASEKQVSDAFVLVGSQFSATVNVFWRHNIDMSDLFDVPVRLRAVLETCLGEDPSPQVVEQYMPDIRRVLYELLQGLRSKQAPYWAAVCSERKAASVSAG